MPAPTPSTFNLPTFIVASIAAASGLAAAASNFAPYVSSGAKIRVRLEYIHWYRDGEERPAFEVKAFNKRRGPMEIREWGIITYESVWRRGRTINILTANTENSDEIPKTLQGGHGASWGVYAKTSPVFKRNKKHSVWVRGAVGLGNGKLKKSVPLRLKVGALHQPPLIISDDEN